MTWSRLLAIISLLGATSAYAAPPTGVEIAKRAEETNFRQYRGQKWDAAMTLYDAKGAVAVSYKLNILLREGSGSDGDKLLIRFLAPPDTKGTALLVHEQKGSDDNRWLYLAETRMLKQVSGTNRSASFKGSEFAYEDLTTTLIDKFEWTLAGERNLDGKKCWDVEAKPRFEGSGYSKMISCYDQERFVVLESVYFDRAGKELKRQRLKDYRQIQNKWRAYNIEMSNVQTGRKTIIASVEYQLGLDLSERLFSVDQLRKN